QSRHLRLGAPGGNDARGQARRFVRLFTDRDVFDEVGILQRPGDFGDNRRRERVPFGQDLALGYAGGFGGGQFRTVRHAETGALFAFVVQKREFRVAGHDDLEPFRVLERVLVLDADFGIERRFDVGTLGATGSGATDVERTHRQLCTRLTDGLRGD